MFALTFSGSEEDDSVLLCSPGWPETGDLPASVSEVLGLQV